MYILLEMKETKGKSEEEVKNLFNPQYQKTTTKGGEEEPLVDDN